MRKLIFALFLFQSFDVLSQNTTQDEYNFLTKGYKQVVASGLDMKKGYIISTPVIMIASDGKYTFTFTPLFRQKDNSFVGTIINAKSHVWDKEYYLGLEAANSDMSIDLQNTLMKQIEGFYWDEKIKTAFIQALAEYMSSYMTAAVMSYNRKK